MRIRKKNREGNNLKMVVIFCSAVVFLLAVSLTIKLFWLFQASLFDGQHRFTVFVTDKKGESNIISFAPDSKTISVLSWSANNSITQKSVEKFLGIPVDAGIQEKKLHILKEGSDIILFTRNMSLHYNDLQTNLTIIDTIRLWLFAKSIPTYSITIKRLTLPFDQMDIADQLTTDKRMLTLFGDETVSREKVSIQIINGTGIAGLGNRIARTISNMGGNVVAVTTANSIVTTSQIAYYGKSSYTAAKLSKMFHAELTLMQKPEISDIIVIIGKDHAGQF